jgi:predicted dehydrogenase
MTTLNYAIIGCGSMGRVHAEVAANDPRSSIRYCVDSNLSRAEDFAQKYGPHPVIIMR